MSRHRQLMMALATLKEEDNYIHFEDDAVLQVLLANGVGDGIGVTYDDAAKVTTISTWFQNNKNITAFEEFAAFSGITNLIKYAFRNCKSLQRIKLPSSINKFSGDGVFEYCTALTEIYLPSTLTSLAAWAFNGCTSLAKVLNLGETQLTMIGNSTFRDCHLLAEITIPASLTSIESSAFRGCALTDIIFPTSLILIGTFAFYNCTSLVAAYGLGETQLAAINEGTFYSCTLLKEIAFPPTIEYTGRYAFMNCNALTKASGLGETRVKVIRSEFFRNCSALTDIILPASLTTIESYAFSGCSALTYIKILATTPPALSSTNAIPSTIGTIYVPDESIEAYKAATNWSSFASKIKGISEMPA